MSKHTPGQWIISTDRKRIITSEDAIDFEIASCTGMDSGHPCPNEKEMEANARLIAAAPDMLKALKEAKLVLEQISNGSCLVSILDAIEKAEGCDK